MFLKALRENFSCFDSETENKNENECNVLCFFFFIKVKPINISPKDVFKKEMFLAQARIATTVTLGSKFTAKWLESEHIILIYLLTVTWSIMFKLNETASDLVRFLFFFAFEHVGGVLLQENNQ